MTHTRELIEKDAISLSIFNVIIKKYHDFMKSKLTGYDFTPNEISTMIYLLNDPETDTAKGISQKYGTTQSLICRSVDSLSKKNYLEVINDKKDRRVNHLILNMEDKELEARLKELNTEFLEYIFQGVPEEEVAVFRKVLGMVNSNIR